jgi:hypothetical protein
MFQAGYELDSNRRYTDAIRARLPSAWARLLNAMPGSCRSPSAERDVVPTGHTHGAHGLADANVIFSALAGVSVDPMFRRPQLCQSSPHPARPRYPPPSPRAPHQPPPPTPLPGGRSGDWPPGGWAEGQLCRGRRRSRDWPTGLLHQSGGAQQLNTYRTIARRQHLAQGPGDRGPATTAAAGTAGAGPDRQGAGPGRQGLGEDGSGTARAGPGRQAGRGTRAGDWRSGLAARGGSSRRRGGGAGRRGLAGGWGDGAVGGGWVGRPGGRAARAWGRWVKWLRCGAR